MNLFYNSPVNNFFMPNKFTVREKYEKLYFVQIYFDYLGKPSLPGFFPIKFNRLNLDF